MKINNLKIYIKRIALISGLLVCLLGFNSFASEFFCNCCGTTISASDKNEAWSKHRGHNDPVNGFVPSRNSVTGEKCKKDKIVVYTSTIQRSWQNKQDQYAELDETERGKLQVINDHPALVGYIQEIFSVNNDNTDEDENANNIFSTYNLMDNITKVCIDGLQKFNHSSLYVLFCFIGILFLFVNCAIEFFQNSYNTEGKTTEQYIRLAFKVIFFMFLVCSVSKISEFFLVFFRYVLDFVWNFTKSGVLVVDQPEEFGLTKAQDVAYNILVAEGLTASSNDLVASILQSVSYGLLCIKFFIPYIISVLGKFGILFAIMNSCVDVLVHAFLFPIAAGDVNENIRQSKFIRYSRHIFASALNLSVIVLVLLVCQVISNGFINELIRQATEAGDSSNVNYFEVSFIMAVLQIVKVVACNSVAKQISSHVAGD